MDLATGTNDNSAISDETPVTLKSDLALPIPMLIGYWLAVLKSTKNIKKTIQECDEPILKALTEIAYDLVDPAGFTLYFHFAKNTFLKNTVLKKVYKLEVKPDAEDPFDYDGSTVTEIIGDKIEWNEGCDPTKKVIKKKQKRGAKAGEYVTKIAKAHSFFHFFDPPKVDADHKNERSEDLLRADFELGQIILSHAHATALSTALSSAPSGTYAVYDRTLEVVDSIPPSLPPAIHPSQEQEQQPRLERTLDWMITIAPEMEDPLETRLQIPAGVRGMEVLNREQFRASFKFPVLAVEKKEVGRLRDYLSDYTIKQFGKRIKTIMDTPDKQSKLFVLNPDVVNSDETRQSVLEAVGGATGNAEREITEAEYSLGFDEWDQRAIFRAVLPEGLEFSSFTQTGHLVNCNLVDELVEYGKIIGEILLAKNATCRTVVNKPDMISNTFRTFDVHLLAGKPIYLLDTIEDGVKYQMIFTKVFWDSRLSHEHARVIRKLSPSSLVFDACAGIGPFVIPAARKHKAPRVIYANDLNPYSVVWLKENMKSNGVSESAISVFNQDAAAFIGGPVAKCIRQHESLPSSALPQAAHIIMNLPGAAVTFLPALRGMLHEPSLQQVQQQSEESAATTLAVAEPFPVIVHCYVVAKADDDATRAREMVEEQLQWEGGVEIRNVHRVRTVPNREEMYCMEIVVPWALMREESMKEDDNGNSEESIARR